MLTLSPDTADLAQRLAEVQGVSVHLAVQRALEESARQFGVALAQGPGRPRLSAAAMLSIGAAVAAMPLRDQRSPTAIMDDLNGP